MDDRIRFEITDGIADVKLVRTDKMNACDNAMFDALVRTTEALQANTAVRVVVLSGEGRAFCAGLDMGRFGNLASGQGDRAGANVHHGRTHGIANWAQQAVWGWRELHCPVIAAVHGVAFGAGFQLMLGADVRFVHPETKLAIMEAKWGLVPDMAGTALMRLVARDDVVRELMYTARVFSGEEAKGYGFATHVTTTPHEAAMALAREIAERSPSAVKAGKRMLNALPGRSEAEILLAESEEQDALIASANFREAVAAGMEKRMPRFADA